MQPPATTPAAIGEGETAPTGPSWDALLVQSGLPRLDARALMEQASGQRREWLLAHGCEPAPIDAITRFEQMAARRRQGEPLAYVLGHREFLGHRFAVNPGVLVPRPETEGLVQAAIDHLPPDARGLKVLDLGTGSGVIAITLTLLRPGIRMVACDLSEAALLTAQHNAQSLGAEGIAWHRGHWFDALPPADASNFAMVVANPPYIAEDDPHLLDPALRHEPRTALACGPTGMEAIEAITAAAPSHLSRGGWLLLEHGATQGAATRQCLLRAGLTQVSTLTDLQGLERVTQGQWPATPD